MKNQTPILSGAAAGPFIASTLPDATSGSVAPHLLLTTAEAAELYRVTIRTIRNWIKARRLKVEQPAGRGGKT